MPSSSRRKKRFSADEARDALLNAGLELLDDRGLETGLARVTLSEAVNLSGVPRPSAYRVFSNGDFDPQEEFRTNLLLHLLSRDGTTGATKAGFDASIAVLVEEQTRLDSGDPDQLAYVLREAVRVATNLIWKETTAREGAHLSTVLALVVDPDPYQPLLDAISTLRAATVERNVGFYLAIMQQFGLRPKPGFSIESIATMLALIVDQIWDGNLAHGAEPYLERPTGPNGESRGWTAFGVTTEGLILVAVEPDPSAPAAARLSSWLESPATD